MPRTLRTVTAATTAVLLLTATTGASAETVTDGTAPATVRWLATGDSYSSGEGTSGNSGACALGDHAWGPAAADVLSRDHGWEVSPLVHAACTGHLVGDFHIRRDRGFVTTLLGRPEKGSFLEWVRELSGEADPTFDVLTLTMGGNDLGFGDTVKDCNVWLEVPNGVSFDGIVGGVPGLGGCDVSEEELLADVEAFADPERFLIDDGGEGGTGRAIRGSMADYYAQLAGEHVAPGGTVVVLGYPRLFAPSGEWSFWYGTRCEGFNRGDANMLGRVAERLDEVLAAQVAEADARLDDITVRYVSAVELYGGREDARRATDGHELCGNGEDWLHGWALDGSGNHVDASFHPNDRGHAEQAVEVATLLAGHDFTPPPAQVLPLPDGGSFELRGVGTSRYSEVYAAEVLEVTVDGRFLDVRFAARGEDDLRAPRTSCLTIDDGERWESHPVAMTLTTEQPGEYAGTLRFPVLVDGTYSFVYSCRGDYSSVLLGDATVPSVGVSRYDRDYYAVVFATDGATLTFVSHGSDRNGALRDPATSCLVGDGEPALVDVTTETQHVEPGQPHLHAGTMTFDTPVTGYAFLYSCRTDYSSVPLP